jgi:multiple sugar transport system substrate-binding protein/putative aldouronate transport system substrate-binding protein
MTLGLAACGSSSSSGTSGASAGNGNSVAAGNSASGSSGTSAGTGGIQGWVAAADEKDDSAPGTNDDRAFQKFDHVVEVHIGEQIDAADTTLPDGDAADNNQYTRYLLDNYNIKVVADWTAGNAADFQQKVSLAIASNSLPDAVVVPNRNYLVQAARSGLLADMGDTFNKYGSKQVKEIVETTNGRAFTNASVDDTFYALPNITVDTDGVYIYFIRQDWLDKLGLEVPKTVSELGDVAQKFMDAGYSKDYAIAGIDNGGRTYSNFLNSSNNGYGFDALYQAFGATPGYFLKDDSGKIYWGTTTDEMKNALTTLHDWYAKGLINPEIGTTTNGDNANNVKNGTCGIFMGPWWSLGYGNGDSFKNDNTANWQAYPLYTDDGKWDIHMKDIGTTYTVVNKNASDDVKKAVVIMNNVLVRDESTFDTSVAIGWYPLRNTMAAADECEHEYAALTSMLKGETKAADYQQGGSLYNGLYKNMANDAAQLSTVISSSYDPTKRLNVTDMDVNTNNGQFNRYYALLIGDRPYATLTPDKKIYSELYYTIDGMDTYWTQVSDLEDQSVLQFITGAKSLNDWDQFCSDWHAQGGDQILQLVTDYLAK